VTSEDGNGSTDRSNGGEEEESSGENITLKIANYYAADHPQNIALEEVFKPMVEEKSNGAITVEIFPNSEIGNEERFTEGVRNGTVEIGILGTILSSSSPKI